MQPDRFAREIIGILALSDAARLRRLMRKPLGRFQPENAEFDTSLYDVT